MKGPGKWKFRHRKDVSEPQKTIRLALVGQPNVGKSVIFNAWTGLGAIVSNYPGTTVELLEGTVYLSYHDVYSPKWHPEIKDWKTTVEENSESDHSADSDDERRYRRKRKFRRGRRFRRWSRGDYFDPEEGVKIEVVDLPGSYTIISPTSEDEKVTLRELQIGVPKH